MLGPAAVIRGRAVPVGVVSGLLAAGALALWALPAPWAWPALAVFHGSAWSLAWAGQLGDRGKASAGTATEAQRGSVSSCKVAALNTGFALSLGIALESFGPGALAVVHAILGGLAPVAFSLAMLGGRRSAQSAPA